MSSSETSNPFDRLPDELLEKIFSSFDELPALTPTNHARFSSNGMCFDYTVHQPLLKQNHRHLLQVSQVCRRFYQIIKSERFWEQKCRHEHVLLPDQHFPSAFLAYEKLYVHNPFHPLFNLIDDNQWKKRGYGESRIEPVPIGSKRLYDECNRLSPCRVTSYTPKTYWQRDLRLPNEESGYPHIAQLRPLIEFSICIAARWDCGSRCSLNLRFSDGHSWACERTFPQWNDQKWHRITYRYGGYEQLPSSVKVQVIGRDTQSWAGFYGIKFAQTRLRLVIRPSDAAANKETETIIEPKLDEEPLPEGADNPIPDTAIESDEDDPNPHDGQWNYAHEADDDRGDDQSDFD